MRYKLSVKTEQRLFLDSSKLQQHNKRMKSFGGSLLKCGHARTARPLSSKDFTHLVLKSELAHQPEYRMTKKRKLIEQIIKKNIQNFGVRIHKLAIAGHHIHVLISFKSRRKYFDWVRRITGLIARLMLKKERGLSSENTQSILTIEKQLKKLTFWSQRPFTRIIKWGRDFKIVYKYLENNIIQAIGFIPYVPRALNLVSTA